MLRYPARLARDGDGFVVSFRDIPEALTGGPSEEEALEMAADALLTAMDFYIEDERPVPPPSEAKRGDRLVELPASASAKVMLLNAMVDKGVRPSDLARRMGIRPQEVQRIMDLNHVTKIDTLESAFAALGKRLEITVE
ncbi:type II toxin-antitoxin system HicB family antitoxin [Burkholderia gladioli]|uniref:type II toxin-antitoxin system HicB family antitoxin n=1 Tax=Burkholderia gladioli TaxID=28095 RepID=UPI0016405698|nr:type II toxin-antitoxin system HicB family antitoxin [Burkholderia gladioli]MDN7917646.1 type II toxin-antitoxin system HicB family antitoxin [Burkholderia gladioli]